MLKKIISTLRAKPHADPGAALMADMRDMAGSGYAVHLAADYMDNPFHVTMWARHFDDVGVPWYVICREHRHMQTLRAAGVRAVWAPKAHHLSMAVTGSVKSIFYVNNGHKNIELLRRFPDLTHVQLLHGDSDKPTSFSPVTSNFDKIFVAGQLGQDRYANNGVKIPDDVFVHIGRPQVNGRTIGQRLLWRDAPVIGYMPTWFGAQGDMMLSSLDRGAEIIRAIRRASPKAKIIFKPHPLIYKDPSYKAYEHDVNAALVAAGVEVMDRDAEASLVYESSDLLVSDISSTMIDYLYSNRPLLAVLPRGYTDKQDALFPSLAGAYRIEKDLSNIDIQLQDALTTDSLAKKRSEIRAYAFGHTDGPVDARFIAAVRKIAL